MQKPDIWKLVLTHLAPTKNDPSYSDWRAYINRYIVPEVRQESIRFFGSTDCVESQNPGLDYASPAHRLRLRCFPHHDQLITVFDKLRLVESEIYTLCKWYGTRRAKEDFERKHRVTITDTTWDGVEPYCYVEPTVTLRAVNGASAEICFANGYNVSYDDGDAEMESSEVAVEDQVEHDDEESGEESEDGLQQSVGVELNERLMASAEANAAARARGEIVTMDAEWEQWLKEAAERGIAPGAPPRINSISGQWGREISEMYTDGPQPDIAILQAGSPLTQQHSHQIDHPSVGLSAIIRSPDLVQPAAAISGPIVEN